MLLMRFANDLLCCIVELNCLVDEKAKISLDKSSNGDIFDTGDPGKGEPMNVEPVLLILPTLCETIFAHLLSEDRVVGTSRVAAWWSLALAIIYSDSSIWCLSFCKVFALSLYDAGFSSCTLISEVMTLSTQASSPGSVGIVARSTLLVEGIGVDSAEATDSV